MANIKGQNLRLFIGNKCVAAATSCGLHINANIQEKSTKDSDEWTENECLGVSWDAQVDALVTENPIEMHSLPTSGWSSPKSIGSETFFFGTTGFQIIVPTGKILCAEGFTENNKGWAILNNAADTVLAENTTGTGNCTYENTGSTGVIVKVAWRNSEPGEGAWVNFYLYDGSAPLAEYADNLANYLINGQRVAVKLATTNGTMNRVEDEVLREGYAYIQDLTITAQNRQHSTYSCKLIGDGELSASE